MNEELRIEVGGAAVTGLLARPDDATCLAVLAHGAGAGMRHPFMEGIAERLVARRIATLRYQFPYTEAGRRRPDPPRLLEATVRAAIAAAAAAAPDLPLVAGGKSMGGRMTSMAAAAAPLPGVRGLFFLGFPLHPAGQPATRRGEHLAAVTVPMLFLQGGRDALADLGLLRPLVAALGARAALHEIAAADHGFHVLVRSGRSDGDVLDELAGQLAAWAR
jgi:predicted alpha/beta-hydrolase family hydrolase